LSTSGAAPVRADARRNRGLVLAAADAVFAERGVAASTEEVARRAGVGVGTVFRHFPTKEALLAALLVERLNAMASDAEAQIDSDDPGAALRELFARMVEKSAAKKMYSEALGDGSGCWPAAGLADAQRRVRHGIGGLLLRAQEAGQVRADLSPEDLFALVVGASRAAEFAGDDPQVQRRTLEVVLDGLRPAGC
jgi:AcrR family transcriptional regulator